MKCPLCNNEGFIIKSGFVVENDDTPDKETTLHIEQTFVCRNANCENAGKEIGSVKNPIQIK